MGLEGGRWPEKEIRKKKREKEKRKMNNFLIFPQKNKIIENRINPRKPGKEF